MHKKIILKITLLLSNASMHATQAKRALSYAAHAMHVFSATQKARYVTPLLRAIMENQVEVAKALLEQGNQNLFIIHPDTGHSLALIAIKNHNIDLISLLHDYGARLLPSEQPLCFAWQKQFPGFFEPLAVELCSAF